MARGAGGQESNLTTTEATPDEAIILLHPCPSPEVNGSNLGRGECISPWKIRVLVLEAGNEGGSRKFTATHFEL